MHQSITYIFICFYFVLLLTMLRMKKEWISVDRLSAEYRNGVYEFLQFSLDYAKNPNAISCPCLHCENLFKLSISKIKEHLFFNGIDQS